MSKISDYLHKKAAIYNIPLGGAFELSPVCNFSCKMCYVRRSPNQIAAEGKSIIPWDQWLDLAKQCKDAGMLYLLLTGGEPFIYPGFRKLYQELSSMGLILSINTNGSMLDEDTVAWLKKCAPSRINLTLYGASPETYERVCGNGSGFYKAIHAIHLLKEANIPTVINCSLIPENAQDLEKIIMLGKTMEINTRVSTYMFPPIRRDREQGDSRFTAKQSALYCLKKLRCELGNEALYDEYLNRIAQAVPDTEENCDASGGEHMQCRAGRSSFWINWEGRMSACGLFPFPKDYMPFREPFLECWKDLSSRIREAIVLNECSGCTKRKYCKPCAAMLYAETGDVNKRSDYLCDLTNHLLNSIEIISEKGDLYSK